MKKQKYTVLSSPKRKHNIFKWCSFIPDFFKSTFKVRWYYFIVFVLLINHKLFAQSHINGRIVNILGEPVPYASVLLLSPTDSLLILGAVSAENGHFQFDRVYENNYLLSVSIVGFNKHYEQLVISTNANVDLHPIMLSEAEDELEEIAATTLKNK